MITDLRVGNCVTIQKRSSYVHGIIEEINSEGCKIKALGKEESSFVHFDYIHPLKVTKRWLRDNEFNESEVDDEGEESPKYTHTSLPITYDHSSHKVFIYGRILPVKVPYIHQLQNLLLDCGINPRIDFRESHCTQIEANSISNLMEKMAKSKEFFDTNSIFGFSGMPKIDLTVRKMSSIPSPSPSPISLYQQSFVYIDEIRDRNIRSILKFFYDYISPDSKVNSIYAGNVYSTGMGLYQLYDFKGRNGSLPMSSEHLIYFLDNYSSFIRYTEADPAISFPKEFILSVDLRKHQVLQEIIFRSDLLEKLYSNNFGSRVNYLATKIPGERYYRLFLFMKNMTIEVHEDVIMDFTRRYHSLIRVMILGNDEFERSIVDLADKEEGQLVRPFLEEPFGIPDPDAPREPEFEIGGPIPMAEENIAQAAIAIQEPQLEAVSMGAPVIQSPKKKKKLTKKK